MTQRPPQDIVIPPEIRPEDGRFGSGPSKVRPEAVDSLNAVARTFMGTSHRQATVRDVVGRLRTGLSGLFDLPDDYEVILGLGGATLLWDAMAFGLVERRSEHLVFGEFSSKCAKAVAAAPHLTDPVVLEAEPGSHPDPQVREDVDLYALTQNETSTGVCAPVARPAPSSFVAVDAVSAAGGMSVDPAQFDFYYFSPQKCFASDGGLWVALCSPAAVERIERIAATDRYIPPSFDLGIALENSRKNQTYNTPALATVFLMAEQVEWMLAQGGLSWAAGRCARSAQIVYDWADGHRYATPFVKDPENRSTTVATIDFDNDVDAKALAAALRANGIVDTEPYRKLGRNQLRIALYPAIEPSDVDLLTRSIDHCIDALVEG